MTPEPGDYTIENGLLVFTEQYHLRRGYCCGNGCRHCPYEHVNVDEHVDVLEHVRHATKSGE